MRKTDLYCFIICLPVVLQACAHKENMTTLSLVDKNATAETKALYSNLWTIQERGFMFGHQDDLLYGREWFDESGRSDTKDVCGDYPGVAGFEIGRIESGGDKSLDDVPFEMIRREIKNHYNRGGVVTVSWHADNPLTGGNAWDNSSDQVVKQILIQDSELYHRFNHWLDIIADFAFSLKGNKGELVPVIFRPFHEHTQTWSWWGASCTTSSEYIQLWQYTIRYLRDIKGVHNFIYAISPQMDTAKTTDDFYFRWPGDEYVDFIGMDCYHGINNEVFTTNLETITQISMEKKKPCGVTETGVNGFTKPDYWTENILLPMTGKKVSYLLTWRNAYHHPTDENHYFSVFKGHVSEKDFIEFYESPFTFFCKDVPDMYTMADNIEVD